MATPAQIAANRKNALRSTGPKSPETKAISARNSLRHGMTGDGRALPQSDLAACEELTVALLADFKPRTERGKSLVRQTAMLMVRLERISLHSLAAADSRERNAADKFDEEREDRAQELCEALSENPRMHLRKLMRTAEGVNELRIGWTDLQAELTRERRPKWTPSSLERAAHLQGFRSDEVDDCDLADLSERLWAESDPEKAAEIRWQLSELIDVQVARLEDHFLTLDHARFAQDREDAGLVASLGATREMELLRRYESQASRRYSECQKELLEIEGKAKAEGRPMMSPPPAPPRPAPRPVPAEKLASFGAGEAMAWDGDPLAQIQLGKGLNPAPKDVVQGPKSAPRPANPGS